MKEGSRKLIIDGNPHLLSNCFLLRDFFMNQILDILLLHEALDCTEYNKKVAFTANYKNWICGILIIVANL